MSGFNLKHCFAPLYARVRGDFILDRSLPFQGINCEVQLYLTDIHHADSLL